MSDALIAIKGTPEGLLVTLHDGEWREIWAELQAQIARGAAFLRGAEVILQVGTRDLDTETLRRVAALFQRHDMSVTSVLSASSTTREAAQNIGLQAAAPLPRERTVDEAQPLSPKDGIILRQSLRSGQTVTAERGAVLIIGNVHAGAEVSAAGDIIVWGRLRGLVHAGAQGNDAAVICALRLEPPQLRIGTHIARAPEGEKSCTPEIARVRDGQIVVESWKDVGLSWQFGD